jgi:hypothetical protein
MNNELYRGFRADKTKERIENKNDIVSGFYHPTISCHFLLVVSTMFEW